MQIHFLAGSDPMITDDATGLNRIGEQITFFLESENKSCFIPSNDEKIGLTFTKTTGPIAVLATSAGGLEISGNPTNLRIWGKHFSFPTDAFDGDHRHPEYVDKPDYLSPTSLSVIIEVQSNG